MLPDSPSHHQPADPMSSWANPKTVGEIWTTRVCVAIMMLSLLSVAVGLVWDVVVNYWKH
jgi:hypothetical protein